MLLPGPAAPLSEAPGLFRITGRFHGQETIGHHQLHMAFHGARRHLCDEFHRLGGAGPSARPLALRHRRAGHGDHDHPAGLCGQRHGKLPHPEEGHGRSGLFLGLLLQPRLLSAAVRGSFLLRPVDQPPLPHPGADAHRARAGSDHRGLRRQERPAGLCRQDHAVSALLLRHARRDGLFGRRRHHAGLPGLRRVGARVPAASERHGQHVWAG